MKQLQEKSIGLQNEKSLHAAIREWYTLPGDRSEVKIDGYLIDIVRGNLLIEIQIKNFSAIRKKLRTLVQNHPVCLIHPISVEKWIVKKLPLSDEIVSRRKSPKRGSLIDIFDELVRVPELISNPNFTLIILMIKEEETRCDDGKGSWRRKGISIIDRKLIEVIEPVRLEMNADFLQFIPGNLPQPFSNKGLACAIGCPVYKARRVTYSLKKMGVITETGKNGNELLFEVVR